MMLSCPLIAIQIFPYIIALAKGEGAFEILRHAPAKWEDSIKILMSNPGPKPEDPILTVEPCNNSDGVNAACEPIWV